MKLSTRINVFLLIVVFISAACSNDEDTSANLEKKESEKPANINRITLSPEMTKNIKTEEIHLVNLVDKIQVPSQIRVDERRLIRVGANVTGRIVEVTAELGDNVDTGATLARISSPELTRAQLDYLRAHSLTVLNERAAKRAKSLLDADVIGRAELQRREAELQVSQAELSAAKDQLRLLGVYGNAVNDLVKHGQILPSVAITVSKGGTVIGRNVVTGQVVEPAELLFKVADLSTVWAVGDVPEHIASNVTVGQHVELEVPALENVTFDGEIVYVANTVNPQTRTVMVRTVVENSDRRLKPAMLTSMRIAETSHEQIVIPESAIVREANKDYVYIDEDNNTYLRISVKLGPEIDNLRPVIAGLSVGQRIVIDGAFDIDNERKLEELE